MGLSVKLTEELQTRICVYIEEGLRLDQACEMAGIPSRTVRTWRKRGATERDNRLYADFYDAVQRAEAVASHRLLEIVRKSAELGHESIEIQEISDEAGNIISTRTIRRSSPRDWKAALALLERTDAERYGKNAAPKQSALAEGDGARVQFFFDDGDGEEEDRMLEAPDELSVVHVLPEPEVEEEDADEFALTADEG